MEYILLYTIPAWKQTLNIFDEFWLYFHVITPTTKFDINKMKKATHAWFWTEYSIENSQKEYIEISYIWEIEKIWNFEISDKGEILDKDLIKENPIIEKAFIKHFNVHHTNDNWEVFSYMWKNIRYIYIKKETIFKFNENILYPTKELISLPLNFDSKWKYLENMTFASSIKINDDCFFSVKDDKIVYKWESIELWNGWVYWKILELLLKSKDCSFYFLTQKDSFAELYKKKNALKNKPKEMTFDYNNIRTTIVNWFNKKFSKYLWFNIRYHKWCIKKSR